MGERTLRSRRRDGGRSSESSLPSPSAHLFFPPSMDRKSSPLFFYPTPFSSSTCLPGTAQLPILYFVRRGGHQKRNEGNLGFFEWCKRRRRRRRRLGPGEQSEKRRSLLRCFASGRRSTFFVLTFDPFFARLSWGVSCSNAPPPQPPPQHAMPPF